MNDHITSLRAAVAAATWKAPAHVACDPKTGVHLRLATDAEVAAWRKQPGHDFMRRMWPVGDVLVDEVTSERGQPSQDWCD